MTTPKIFSALFLVLAYGLFIFKYSILLLQIVKWTFYLYLHNLMVLAKVLCFYEYYYNSYK